LPSNFSIAVGVGCSPHFYPAPAELPEGATGFVDFVSGGFSDGSSTNNINTILVADPTNGWNYSSASVEPGVGLVGSGANSSPRLAGGFLDQILAGSTFVTHASVTETDGCRLNFMLFDDPDFNYTWQYQLKATGANLGNSVFAADEILDTSPMTLAAGNHKIAVTFADGVAKLCIDGGVVTSADASVTDFGLFNAAGMGLRTGAIITTIAIYPPADNATMQALTTL
jgi:hypothetical protein